MVIKRKDRSEFFKTPEGKAQTRKWRLAGTEAIKRKAEKRRIEEERSRKARERNAGQHQMPPIRKFTPEERKLRNKLLAEMEVV